MGQGDSLYILVVFLTVSRVKSDLIRRLYFVPSFLVMYWIVNT